MFTKIASQIGFSFEKWQIHESNAFNDLTFTFTDAQLYKNVTWIVGDAGCGKNNSRHQLP